MGNILDKKRYQLRISGMESAPGKVSARMLCSFLETLMATAERATSLFVTGEGSRKGPKPRWLAASTDFTVVGIKSGSTICEVEVSPLCHAAPDIFAQIDMWPEQTRWSGNETTLDLATRAINEAKELNTPGNLFDNSVLDSLLELESLFRDNDGKFECTSNDSADVKFTLDKDTFPNFEKNKRQIPSSQSCIISGLLNEIAHSDGRFQLKLDNGRQIIGKVQKEKIDIEELRPLWGNQATVQGVVHFKVNGQPRLIKANKIQAYTVGDSIFDALPTASDTDLSKMVKNRARQAGSFDPLELAGTWPDDEPIEDLLAELD